MLRVWGGGIYEEEVLYECVLLSFTYLDYR